MIFLSHSLTKKRWLRKGSGMVEIDANLEDLSLEALSDDDRGVASATDSAFGLEEVYRVGTIWIKSLALTRRFHFTPSRRDFDSHSFVSK